MHSALLLPAALGHMALVRAQGAPPPPQTLTATQSGVLPVLPTPFTGIETNEGAIVYDGGPNPGFVGPGGSAVQQTNLPTTSYEATLPPTMFDALVGTTIQGSISGVGTAAGVQFSVNFTGFPDASYGPFVYHIHTLPVPANGNCSATVGHLDPTNRGELYACDVANPQTCQAGDLAGKHGNITTSSFTANYVDPYLSTVPGSPYFFGDKSIVIHTTNTTRLICANFVQVGTNGTGGASPTSPSGPSSSPTITPYTGAAATIRGLSANAAAGGALLVGVMGAVVTLLI